MKGLTDIFFVLVVCLVTTTASAVTTVTIFNDAIPSFLISAYGVDKNNHWPPCTPYNFGTIKSGETKTIVIDSCESIDGAITISIAGQGGQGAIVAPGCNGACWASVGVNQHSTLGIGAYPPGDDANPEFYMILEQPNQ